MRRGFVTRVGTFVVLVSLLGLAVGCAASKRSQSRMQVLHAENIDLMQRTQTAEQRAQDALLAQDRTVVTLQQERHRTAQLDTQLSGAERRAVQGDQALSELRRSREDNLRTAEEIQAIRGQIDRLQAIRARPKPCAPTAPAAPQMAYQPSPHSDAFAQDLRARLASSNIGLPVEVRTTRDGYPRVAVVLENSFPAGKASLASSMDSVRAVVGLGQLLSRSYPGSQVSVQGHTDSDPPRKCPFPSNEA